MMIRFGAEQARACAAWAKAHIGADKLRLQAGGGGVIRKQLNFRSDFLMNLVSGRALVLGLALGAAVLSTGCTRIKDRQGYLIDETLVSAIQPGVDNQESVAQTLGRPTFVGQFDQRDWYYVSRDTRQLAFAMPTPEKNTVLHIRFDAAGNVQSVQRSGMEREASIDPESRKTPTLGRERSLFEEIFGNIGTVGATGQAGQTADNPR
jgi:outer membrane protein assembly factor BamE (lipoprotein component of BamABCDE complex)